jgi:hypothetical protein
VAALVPPQNGLAPNLLIPLKKAVAREVGASKMETLNTKPISSRLRQRLSEPAMLDLTQRLIAIPSENPPGNQYEECARVLSDELDRIGFAEVRREGACVLRRRHENPF